LCGHCRQILMSFAHSTSTVISVSMLGKFTPPQPITELLPQAFLLSDLNLQSSSVTVQSNAEVLSLLSTNLELKPVEITRAFETLCPLIIDENNRTSSITKCILEFDGDRYVPGVLVQDPAFLTTDALFGAYGFAVCLYGHNALSLKAVHLYCESVRAADVLSGAELALLATIMQRDVSVLFYKDNELRVSKKFSDCLNVYNTLFSKLQS
jgi:hypothetical protein